MSNEWIVPIYRGANSITTATIERIYALVTVLLTTASKS